MSRWILLTQLASTLSLVGLIWTIQVVHYPLFDRVAAPHFAGFARDHGRRTSWVVGPPMLVEMLTAAALVRQPAAGSPLWLPAVGLVLLAAVWVATALLQVPAHRRLARGFDAGTHRYLVRTNWIRTVLWTARGALALAMTAAALA